jgi:YVTN family beta-propeller protein
MKRALLFLLLPTTVSAFGLLAQRDQVSDRLSPSGVTIRPAGQTLVIPARPVDFQTVSGRRRLFVKDNYGIRLVDVANWKVLGALKSPEGTSLVGMDAVPDGSPHWPDGTVFFTSSANAVLGAQADAGGTLKLTASVRMPGPDGKGAAFPCGIGLADGGRRAYVCLSRNNTVAVVDLVAGKVEREIPVGIAPYQIALSGDGKRAYVTNQGGRQPITGEKTAPSAGTEVPVDERGVAKTGSVSIVDLVEGREEAQIPVGLQPADLLLMEPEGLLLVANANSDSVTWVDLATRRRILDFGVKPDAKLPFGSMPNALALSPDRKTLYVANAGNNALAVLDLTQPRRPRSRGFIPTGWYPTGVLTQGETLLVANLKGIGSRSLPRPKAEGHNSHDYTGSLQKLRAPSGDELGRLTRQVKAEARIPQVLRANERVATSRVRPVPVPKRLGDPSTIEHVVYVIKENRTYDQIFGDLPQGKGDPRLCLFPEAITPNHHALAREFVLLDNYYCNGILSADGHSWATEANVTPYLERAFGGFNRSYTFGNDPITYSSTGFLWDRVLDAGLSFRNYGEMDYAEPPKGVTPSQIFAAHRDQKPMEFSQNIGIERLRRYSSRDYPGWNMAIPDALRMDRFLKEFREFERTGGFPNLTIVYLPQDHAGGPFSTRAHLADNDLAVGRLVEAISRSRFWPKTAIFINEDDPQAGFDHVDGHRSVCLVVSPYTKRGKVVSEFYNQTSVVHTMLRMLGLPPLNQRDASSSLMSACFTDRPNLTPYRARPATIPIDELVTPTSKLKGEAKKWALIRERLPLARTGQKTPTDEANLNRILWHDMRGYKTRYPAEFAGAHGRGLKERKLKHDPTGD